MRFFIKYTKIPLLPAKKATREYKSRTSAPTAGYNTVTSSIKNQQGCPTP